MGLKLVANPEGADAASATAPVNPLNGEIEILRLAEVPAGRLSPKVLGAMEKSGGGRTVRITLAECASPAPSPVNVTV